MEKLVTVTLSKEVLWQELYFLIEYFSGKGMQKCEVLFGYSWGIYYYGDLPWEEEQVDLVILPDFIRKVESKEFGNFGDSDLVIVLSGMKFNFCHERDIHVEFKNGNTDALVFMSRWKKFDYLV